MWEPRRLTTLWASAACYRDSFTFYFLSLLEDTHLEDRDGNGRTNRIKSDFREIGSEDGSFMELVQDHVFWC
jgi:hypothetical protein